jgi:hypothetical protein
MKISFLAYLALPNSFLGWIDAKRQRVSDGVHKTVESIRCWLIRSRRRLKIDYPSEYELVPL